MNAYRFCFSLMALGLLYGGADAASISLDFSTLPSAQGWTYETSTGHVETDLFAVDGTRLSLNTMGTGTSTGLYTQLGIIDNTQSFVLDTRLRVLESEDPTGNGSADEASAFSIGVKGPPGAVVLSFNATSVRVNNIVLPFNTTVFHDYRVEYAPGVGYDVLIDGVLNAVLSNTVGLSNRVCN